MKKIILMMILLLTLTSCFGEKEQDENKVEVKTTNIKLEVNSNSGTVAKKIVEEKGEEDFSQFDKSFKKETGNFIEKLNKNPDILREVKCDDFKIKETLDFCKKEKEKYLKIMGESKKNIEPKNTTEIEVSKILKDGNVKNKNELTEEEKKNSVKVDVKKGENIKEVNKEVDILIKEYNEKNSIIENKNCENYKYNATKDLCNTMKKDYKVFTKTPIELDKNNGNISKFMKKLSKNPDFLETVDCEKEEKDIIEFCKNLKTKNVINSEPVPENINKFFEKIDKNSKILETINCEKEEKDVVETCNNVKKDYLKNK